MKENTSEMITIAVSVILVAAVVTIVLQLMSIGSGIMGAGQNKLQTGLSLVQQQDLTQYSNVTKKGSVVKSTIQLYQGEPVAILVKTTALYNLDTNRGTAPISGKGMYFNYGCLIKGAAQKEIGAASNKSKHMILDAGTGQAGSALVTIEGQPDLEAALQITNGIKETNYDTSGTVATGNYEAILDNGIFYSQLIKDITGEIIGIVFTQQK